MASQLRSLPMQAVGALLGLQSRTALVSAACCSFASAASAPTQSSAAIIKQLRERSGAPIADVKALLVEHSWDMDRAYEGLRTKGLAAAAKKTSRHASEGLVGVSFAATPAAPSSGPSSTSSSSSSSSSSTNSGGCGSVVVVELNSETDFVARNSLFQGLLRQVMAAAHSLGGGAAVGADHQLDLEQLLRAPTAAGPSVAEAVTEVAVQVRENVRLRRAFRVDSADGLVYSYVHQSIAPGLGKLASVVVLQAEGGAPLAQGPASSSGAGAGGDALAAAGEGLAMHVAGMRPAYLQRSSVPAEALERERALLGQQLQQDAAFQGKPQQVLAKVVEGRLAKTLSDWCLAEQRYVLDDSVTVQQMLKRLGKEGGRPAHVAAFLRVQCGEGLGTKGGADFATEVARIVDGTA